MKIGPDSGLRFDDGDVVTDKDGKLWRIKHMEVRISMTLVEVDYQPLHEGAEAILPIICRRIGEPDDPTFGRTLMQRHIPEELPDDPR